jgi:hypothetical protein
VKLVVSFGAPTVGSLKILDETNVSLYRHGNDFVTWAVFWFRNCRKQVKLGDKLSWHIVTNHFLSNYKEASKA